MERELEAGPITPKGFTLLPIGKMVERIRARLKKEGMTEAELPKRREVKRWRNRLERLREIERTRTTKWRTASRSACATSGAPRR
jgi:hypothetical protein